MFACYVVFWRRHYRETQHYTRIGFDVAVESGDLNYACYHCILASDIPLLCGEPLEDVLREVERRFDFVRRVGYAFVYRILLSIQYLIQSLRGRPVHFSMLDGSELDQDAFEMELDPADFQSAHGYYYSAKAQALFVLGSPGEAAAAATSASVAFPWRNDANAWIVESFFYRALALAACCSEASPSLPPELPDALLACERQLGEWAESCRENFLHKHALVRAEIARLRGDESEAIRLYEQAISSAREHGFVQIEAIACERAAGFYRARGLSIPADAYLQKARAGYFRWGAHAKVEQLDQRYPHLVERKPIAPTITFAVRAEQFDVLSVVKASQSISGELKLPRLLETLLRIVIEHAGADQGSVLLVRDEHLSVAAQIIAREGTVRLLDAGEDSTAALPQSILHYVRRTREGVLLDDAAARHPFVEDEYFTRTRPRSLLCLPIAHQTRLLGMLYLENSLVTGAFTAGRLSVLELLASQSAISLENAMLYSERRQAERAQRFLAEASRKLMALGYDATLENVTALAVPELSDQCIVTASEDGGQLHTAAAGVRPDELEALREVLARAAAATPAEPELGDSRATPLWQQFHVHSYLRVPLLARDRRLGVMFLLATSPRRRYGRAALTLAEELGRRAALALDNARLYARAQEAIGMRDEFLMIASHELRTPLTSMQMQIEMAERLLRRDPSANLTPGRLTNMFQVLDRQMARVGHLVDELLDVSRLHTGRLTLAREPVELAALTREIVERMAPQLAAAGCRTELEMDEPVVGYWDKLRLEQVIINLLSNAMKYGMHWPIHVRVRRQAASALFTVRDHGIGIPAEDQARIFDRFERAVSVRHFGGLGLGLYLVRWIVTSHGGSIRVESKPNAGATFVVELPLRPQAVDHRDELPPPPE